MDVFNSGGICARVLRLEVHHLAADHAIDGPGAASNFSDDAYAGLRCTGQLAQYFVGMGLKSVTGENCNILAEYHVTGGLASTQIVVVERRKVVVN